MFSGMPSFHFLTLCTYQLFTDSISCLDLRDADQLFYRWYALLFIAMLIFGMNTWVALVGSIAFAFSTNHIVLALAGHYTKLGTIAFFQGF